MRSEVVHISRYLQLFNILITTSQQHEHITVHSGTFNSERTKNKYLNFISLLLSIILSKCDEL